MKKKYKFLLYALILILIKQILMHSIPILAVGNSTCDDQLMINLETHLLQFDWLGPFNSLTFVKGMFFPLFLAVLEFIGISYIEGTTLLYSLSCLVFVYAVKDLFKNRYPLFIIFTILLFNPIMFSNEVIGRVYRNSLTPSQVLLILGSVFYIFINRNEKVNKKTWLFSILGGISLLSFYNTREDAIWIMPFIVLFTGYLLIEHFCKKKNSIKKTIIYILPIVILFVGNNLISFINYTKYGVYTRVDESNTPFTEAMQTIYSVPPNKDIKYVSVTREKLERIYKVSPTMNSISTSLDRQIKEIDAYGRNPNDNEIEDGWFWWAFRFAAEENGYFKDAKTANKFFSDVAKEIKKAQKEKLLDKQMTMPSSLMSPWRKGYFNKLISTSFDIVWFTTNYKDITISPMESSGTIKSIQLFEMATNNKAIYPIETKIYGWYKYDDEYVINIIDEESNNIIDSVNCGYDKCIIDTVTNIDPKNIVIEINDTKIKLDKNQKYNDDYISYDISVESNYDAIYYQKKITNTYTSRLNIITKIYQLTGFITFILGLISYLIISFIALFKNHKVIDKWLILSGIIGSYLVLVGGVAYNEISSCYSITYMYLSGSYPLIICFWTISIFILLDIKKNNLK